jgi:hypothetical protein
MIVQQQIGHVIHNDSCLLPWISVGQKVQRKTQVEQNCKIETKSYEGWVVDQSGHACSYN